MRKVLTSLAVVAALAFASSSYAVTGTATMGWNGCNASPITDLAITAGQATGINLMVFMTGQDDQATAYQTQILYANSGTKTVPDAWRFDASGCQTSSFVTLNHQAPASVVKTCPTFRDAGAPHSSLEIKTLDFEPPGFPYPTTLMRIQVAVALTAGAAAPVAGTKYFLMDAEFNESFGIVGPSPGDLSSCGNLETPMCFNLNSCSYIINDGSGNEISFNFHGGADWATANAGGAGGCQGSPAVTKTWGQIKNQYRN
jgi:hypothetical protein